MTEQNAIDWARLSGPLAGDTPFTLGAREARIAIALEGAGPATVVSIAGGNVAVGRAQGGAPDIRLTASPAAWSAFASPAPAVGYQTINGMLRAGHLAAGGDLLQLARHLLLIESVLARVRPATAAAASPPPVGTPRLEGIIGRYLHLDIAGRPHRVYFEEAGPADGIPLLCLHTAGSDGRQYRGILNHAGITRRWRVIAFDLPRHGKSSPPAGFEREVYSLTTGLYVETVMAVCAALKLDRPAVMGCSIGGRAVLHLALRHPRSFRAAIGLQSALAPEPGAMPIMRDLGVIARPDVHGGMASAGNVDCLIAPQSPRADRYETLWHYAQSAPGVFAGDLQYYAVNGNMTAAEAAPLKGGACPVYLLTGEYDLSATPARTAELAQVIEPAHFEVMKGLGHFPMSESPDAFCRYLEPVLARIAARA